MRLKVHMENVKRTCFVGVLQLVLHLVCCYILASRTFNLNSKLNKEVQLYRHVQLQSHRHVAFLLCFHLFHFSMWFIREQFCYVRFSVCTSLHPVPHGTLNFE